MGGRVMSPGEATEGNAVLEFGEPTELTRNPQKPPFLG
jgi:hypothetical protein